MHVDAHAVTACLPACLREARCVAVPPQRDVPPACLAAHCPAEMSVEGVEKILESRPGEAGGEEEFRVKFAGENGR